MSNLHLPFTILKYLHNNFSNFISTNDDKIDIIDSNVSLFSSKI